MTLPHGQHVEVDGARLHLHDLAPQADPSGYHLWLLHGSGPGASGWSNFHQNVPPLTAAGHRVFVPDHLGFGHSSMDLEAFPWERVVGAHARAWDALGLERVVLVGNSMGGAMALQLALDLPERVQALVLMAPGGLEPRDTYMAMPGIRAMLRCIFGPTPIDEDAIRRVFSKQLHDASRLSPVTVAERLEVARVQPRKVFETLQVPDLSERLAEVRCPTLGLWGVDDQFCPVSGATRLTAIPDSRVIIFTRCGHWVMVEHQRAFDTLLAAFLEGRLH